MKKYLKKYGLVLIGTALGAVAGYFYWRQIGCANGSCAIVSRPLNSTLYGALWAAFYSRYSLVKATNKRYDVPRNHRTGQIGIGRLFCRMVRAL